MGLFSGIQDATPTGLSGNYIKPGVHLLELMRCTQGQSRKKVGFMVAEFKVISSDAHSPGERVSYMCMADKDNFVSNCKALFLAIVADFGGIELSQLDHSSIDEDTAETITAEPGTAYKGVKLLCTAINVPIKSKPGEMFTKCIWDVSAPEESQENPYEPPF